ncbi:hypothetical protein C1645_825961 [Glomus cerebriforme]|uniref:Uncharacterized protein n=1 Tax=Glomus cerebriforme TaxID=658196 RepID=A0A397T0U9_9GLOM|nr:hypothetical protein C1645_825961 [Glomus cerebriforme]
MSSQASSPSSPSLITEEISTRIMLDVVKDFDTKELIEYLKKKNLKLKENKVNKEDIINIKQFTSVFKEINDNNKAFNHYMENIILKLLNVKTITDANEATHCEFISTILYASIAITKKLTTQDIFIVLQKDISGEDAIG